MSGELRRFVLEAQPLRGQWVRLGSAWQELRACFTSCGPSLLDSGECCRKIEILSTRALHYAREHRVVEAIPPGLERGRWDRAHRDSDGDGVPDRFDRRPNNPNRS